MTGPAGCDLCLTNPYGRGLCRSHYLKAWRDAPEPDARRCDECDRPHYARGLCHRCYQTARKSGRLPARPAKAPKRLTPERQRLAETCLRLAFKAAQPFIAKRPWAREDFESAALYGLVLAAAGFRPERGFAFTTYAGATIRNQLIAAGRKLNVGAQADDFVFDGAPSRELSPPDEAAYREGLASGASLARPCKSCETLGGAPRPGPGSDRPGRWNGLCDDCRRRPAPACVDCGTVGGYVREGKATPYRYLGMCSACSQRAVKARRAAS